MRYDDEHLQRARAAWRWRGQERPPFAKETGPGQESVWDYPRPPRLETEPRLVRVEVAGMVLAESRRALRVLETASAPAVYLPADDAAMEFLVPTPSRGGICEWKGPWHFWRLEGGGRTIPQVGWSYPEPFPGFEAMAGYLSFYPAKVDGCFLGDEKVRPQPGGFYGGWVTRDVVGPMKGEPGTGGW